MPQDQEVKHAYEHADKLAKEQREEDRADAEVNEAVLHADNHTGQQGMLPTDDEPIEGDHIKALREMLPEFHKDELRRISVQPRGTRLKQGGVYLDLRFREAGELTAHGEEEVHDELLVAKHDVDYEIWNKLLRK